MDLLKDLQWRGLVYQHTDETGLADLLSKEKIKLYCGVDPTADSLHIGHLVAFLLLRRFQKAGHTPIVLVGGATGTIGDPSGKKEERKLLDLDDIQRNVQGLKKQLGQIFDFDGDNAAIMVNNYDWISQLNILDVLRDYGKNFNVNQMLSKENVSSRLDTGISFTEFSYQILQAIDFNHLYESHNCRLQIGGSDQWGNIVTGLELIRKKQEEGAKAYGMTLPLVTKADGTKFGKTEGGAVWLAPEKTTPYEFYQFWINVDDRDVVQYLKYFTFLSHEEITALEKSVQEAPEKREAQKALAASITALIHGEVALQQAINISNALFKGEIGNLTADEIEQGFKDVPSFTVSEEGITLVDLLVQAKISSSKRQAREDITNGAISINGERVQDLEKVMGTADKIENKYTIVRRGKKKYFLMKW